MSAIKTKYLISFTAGVLITYLFLTYFYQNKINVIMGIHTKTIPLLMIKTSINMVPELEKGNNKEYRRLLCISIKNQYSLLSPKTNKYEYSTKELKIINIIENYIQKNESNDLCSYKEKTSNKKFKSDQKPLA